MSFKKMTWGAGIVAMGTSFGCESGIARTKPEKLIGLSSAIPSNDFRLPAEPGMKRVCLAIAVPTSAVDNGRAREFEEVTRSNLTTIFVSSPNYLVANRSVTREASGEWKLRQSGAASAPTSNANIASPSYLVKANVNQVERAIQSDGSKTEWQLGIAVSAGRVRRDGAVEVLLEVVDVNTLETLFTTKSYGLLYEEESEAGFAVPAVGSSRKSSTRVPEAQAIEAACQDASLKVHGFFRQRT